MSCHVTYINPPGFAMEAFNAVGTWQTTESFERRGHRHQPRT